MRRSTEGTLGVVLTSATVAWSAASHAAAFALRLKRVVKLGDGGALLGDGLQPPFPGKAPVGYPPAVGARPAHPAETAALVLPAAFASTALGGERAHLEAGSDVE